MVSNNIPQVKLGIIAVSRDCFPIALSTQRRENIVKEYKGEIFKPFKPRITRATGTKS
jgi:L-fucose isomerase-like protein